ncbi:MAG: helix-turn-helix domain-containing protein [Clostridia bacterium]|nr:helix-turn-helix domain-containing protein [Clostridia bacterium]
MDIAKIGEFIKSQRTAQGMTQKELAEKIGCTDKAVSRWETGKGLPDMSFIIPLSEELKVSVNELLRGERLLSEAVPTEQAELVTEIIKKNDETLLKVIEVKEKDVKRQTKISVGLLILFLLQMVTFFIVPSILPHQWSSAEVMLILTAVISVGTGFCKSRLKWLFPVAVSLVFLLVNLFYRTEDGFLGFVVSLYFAAGSLVIILLCSVIKWLIKRLSASNK